MSEKRSAADASDDRRTITRIANGDERALGELYTRHGRAVFGYLLGLVSDRRLAEELLQDTFVAAWRGAAGYRANASAKTWLFSIARRRARDSRRRNELAQAPEEYLGTVADTEPGPEQHSLANAEHGEIIACMERLAPVHREVLLLVFFEGLSYRDASEVVGVPIGTVKSRLSGAKRALGGLLSADISADAGEEENG